MIQSPTAADLLRRATNRLERIYEQSVGDLDVTIGDLAVLACIDRHEPVIQADICKEAQLDSSNCHRILVDLRQMGCIADVIIANPGRAGRHPCHYYLLSEGRKVLNIGRTALARAEMRLFAPLSQRQRDAFLASLGRAAGMPA